MAKSSKKGKNIKPFDEQNTNLAMGKSVSQQAKTDVLNSIKRLTKEGKHNEAQALYREQFPKV